MTANIMYATILNARLHIFSIKSPLAYHIKFDKKVKYSDKKEKPGRNNPSGLVL